MADDAARYLHELYGTGHESPALVNQRAGEEVAPTYSTQDALRLAPKDTPFTRAMRYLSDWLPTNRELPAPEIPLDPRSMSALNMAKGALGSSANWLDWKPEVGPDTLAPLGLAGLGSAPAGALASGAARRSYPMGMSGTAAAVSKGSDIDRLRFLNEQRGREDLYSPSDYRAYEGRNDVRGMTPEQLQFYYETKQMAEAGHKGAADMLAMMDANGAAGAAARSGALDVPRAEAFKAGREAFDAAERPFRFNADQAKGSAPGAIVNGLDMSQEARMARAKEMGFDIDAYKGYWPYEPDSGPIRKSNGEVIDQPLIPLTEMNAGAGRGSDIVDKMYGMKPAWAGFFSDRKDVANRFADYDGGAVMAAKLKMQNPFVIDAGGKHAAAFQFERIAKENGTLDQRAAFQKAFADDSPYDGVILKNTKDEGDVYIPRKPQQVRSRFAAFDPSKADSANLLAAHPAASVPGVALTGRELNELTAEDLAVLLQHYRRGSE